MANAQTQAIVLKDFTGGIWLNEGEPPDNRHSSFIENLDLLPGGGVQKREPVRLNYKILTAGAGAEELFFQSYGQGGMVQWLQNDPTNGQRYVIMDETTHTPANARFKCFDRTTSTIVWTVYAGSECKSFDFASSDAGANWYTHNQTVALAQYRVTPAGVATALTATYNDNVSAPTNGNMPRASVGTQHLSAYYFVGDVWEAGPVLCPNRLRWSHPGRFEDYRTSDKLDIGDSSNIVGLYSVAETLLIVKENSLWVLTGFDPDTFQVHKVADFTGNAVAASGTPRLAGCANTQQGAFIFIASAGIFRWDGKHLSDISGGLKNAILDGRVNIRHMAILGGVLYCTTGVANVDDTPPAATDLSWEYDLALQSWTQYRGAAWTGLAPCQSAVSGNPKGYAVQTHGHNGGYSFSFYRQRVAAGSWCDNWTGSNVDIVCQYRSPWQDAKNPARKKRWRRPWIVANKRPNASASDPVTYGTTVFRNWDGVHAAKTGTIMAVKATDTTDYDANFGYGHATTGSDFDEGLKIQALGSAFSVQLLLSSSGTPKDQWGFDSLTFKFVPMVLR